MEIIQVCLFAGENGMLKDPRITSDHEPNLLIEDCGFSLREELIPGKFNNVKIKLSIPCTCGNCKWYSVQQIYGNN